MIDYSDIESLIEQCFNEMHLASLEKYDTDKADRTAALFLKAQLKLSFLIEEAERDARGAKNEISRIEGEKYFLFKTSSIDKKVTENMLSNSISKDADIVNSKAEHAKNEANLKKWIHILDVLKEGHIFFRNLSKNKTWAE